MDDELTCDRLTRDVWLWQRRRGHRFSVDDVATAWVAARAAPDARPVLDLGCGIGSVLLHLAWSLPEATLVGIEAQAISFALLGKNIAHNDLGRRVTGLHGDLRDRQRWVGELGSAFDLITGTPPYFPVSAALEAEDEQRMHARIEVRGGIEDYIGTGAALLAPGGRLVVCGDARAGERVEAGRRGTGLVVLARSDVVAKAPSPPLFSVWTLGLDGARSRAETRVETITIRDPAGARTDDAARLRAFSGL